MHVHTPQGPTYVPRVYARHSTDGHWEAWLEFRPTDDDSPVLVTDRETSQASEEAVAMWAAGLEPVYFEGAFARARVR